MSSNNNEDASAVANNEVIDRIVAAWCALLAQLSQMTTSLR
jgi:hypothetical protein